MKVFERLLTEQANVCLDAAERCQNQKAAALLRLLAVDLLLEAQLERRLGAMSGGNSSRTSMPTASTRRL